MSNMVCSLCLEKIEEDEKIIIVDERSRHETCSIEFEKMVWDLEKIYDDTCPKDI